MVGFKSGDTLERGCVMHHYIGPAPGIMAWGGIGYGFRTSLVRIVSTLNSQRYIFEVLEPVVLPYLQGLANRIMRDHTLHALSKGSSSITRLRCYPGRLALRIFRR
ncbi:transposable element Tcb1 transposase [Trichonephila clavipes]|nr:transposable element Tcb1 transposase [Trichonephila clavipes]